MDSHLRRTKIVCTIGPATSSEDKIAALIAAGMNVARLNFSHGSHADHAAVIATIRRVSRTLAKPVSILQDLQGPKIRTGTLKGGVGVMLKDQAALTITTRDVEGTEQEVSTTYQGLPGDVKPGDKLLLDDGKLELQVEKISGPDVLTRVVRGGILKEHKGINLPGVLVNIPSLTEKDREDLVFGVGQGVDYVAISFVRRPEDIATVKRALVEIDPNSAKLPIIAKLEKPAALDNLEAILQVSDGVMVARGDLGVELSPQQVPTAQKRIIEAANRQRKIVITATQMLESMITSPLPTRAEASDVANAIYDGSDAVMLSGETAAGQYPIEAVRMMVSIIKEAETHINEWGRWKGVSEATSDDSVALARAARELATDRDVTAIAIFTLTGRNARIMSKARAAVPILAFTPDPKTYQRLPLLWGVTPYLIPQADTVEAMLAHVEAGMLSDLPVQAGQQVIVIAGLPPSKMVPANFILLHTVGRSLRRQYAQAWLFYFFYFGAFGCYIPFLSLYFQQAGLNGRAIGLLAALPPLVQLTIGPVWGALGDRFAIHRWLLPLATLGPIVPSLLMLTTNNVAVLTALVILAGVFTAPILLLIDSAVLDMVRGTNYSYGKIRIGGSIGYTLFTWLMGYILNWQGIAWLFYGYGAGLLVAGVLAFWLPARKQVWQATSFRKSVGQLLRQRPLVLFLIGSFLVAAALQTTFSFYPLRLVALGGDPVWVGLSGVIGAVFEMPVLYYSNAIFRRLGVQPTVAASYILFAIRWTILALAVSPVLLLATAALNGVTFTPYMAGGILYVEKHTPPGLHATAQGLLAAVTFGLGAAVGALGGGVLYDAVGAQGLFGVAAAMTLVAAGFVVLAARAGASAAQRTMATG